MRLTLAGPTAEYEMRVQETLPLDIAAQGSANEYLYTFEAALPDDASGSYAVSPEARRNVVLNAGLTTEVSLREVSDNPVFYFGVTDAVASRGG